MSNVSVRVELPGHSHSFLVEALDTSSVRSIKTEIAKTCPGGPRVEGQRLIYGGRVLRDEEKIQDIWTSPQDLLTIHLAVHPSAWTTNPPDRQGPTPTSGPAFSQMSFTASGSTPTHQSPPLASSSQPSTTFPTFLGHHHHTPAFSVPSGVFNYPHLFIAYKHDCAIAALTTGSHANLPSQFLEASRRSAMLDLQRYGWSWPSVFDEPIPTSNEGEGVRYERVNIEGQLYLSLVTPNAKPTALQIHALKTLSYTFSILSMPPPTPISYSVYYPYSLATQYPMPPAGAQNLNARLQDLGLPPLRAAQNGIAGVQIRTIPLRALLAPMIMLIIRTLLLVYFFAPSKTPFFGLILGAWITYEAWNAFRIALRPARGRGEQRGAAPQAADGAAPLNAQAQQREPPGAAASAQPRDHTSVVLDTLANINLSHENDVLSAAAPIPERANEPTFAHKVQTFFTLLITTVHPALWNRRRTELMRREGRIRTEANMLQPDNGNAAAEGGTADTERRAAARVELREQHTRRPVWVREYVDRVRNAEFAEE